jgi:EamA domain-containing membrane protein RarD
VPIANRETHMRKVHIALGAAALLALAGVLVAAPKATTSGEDAAAMATGFSIYDLTRRANDLPVESFPAH